MAPNVRFTRSPDLQARKPATEEAVAQPVAPARPAAPAPARPTSTLPATTAAPAAPLSRPSAPAQQQPATPRPQAPRHTAQSLLAVRSSWAHLSDHAFFELIQPRLEVATPPVARPRVAPVAAQPAPLPAKPVQRLPSAPQRAEPRRQIQATDITSLYRIIECAIEQPPFSAPASDLEADEAPEPALETAVGQPAAHAQEAIVSGNDNARMASAVAVARPAVAAPAEPRRTASRAAGEYELPSEDFLQEVPEGQGFYMSQERLEQNADLLESVLEDFGVRGEIIHVRPGPVVTLYEFEPAPGVKSSRVINLADDIARSMSAISARVAVVPGRNVIGIELPNETRETVYFRELIESDGFRSSSYKLPVCLGKTIGGEPVIAELAKMPHLLVAGTTGSGKSVAINTMILSLLYRLKPEECRLIMVDPKMLELSVYDGIPHLLTPVVTDSKKAVTALKWAVREMEDRYRKMARLGVRNIDGYNQRAAVARDNDETVTMQVQTGFEKGTGQPQFEEQEIDLSPMPYIVVIVDEMADLMMVAGKEIEGAIQRLAQMARAAGIHLIMATQRPSVDVITGTIKANFPTRISFQVTSKIDSRTILGEQGAEQLLGQGDMLHTAGGGRISRVHGPFVSDAEVERVVAHLKTQGTPDYLDTVTSDEEDEVPEEEDAPVFDKSALAAEDGADPMFDEAVKVVLRDKKCSTSYIQRRL
ncbi:MAG TPA: DNA translocase FtsK, partial [Rhizobiaceae bacterium]